MRPRISPIKSTRTGPWTGDTEVWVERIRAGDRQAFNALVETYSRDLIQFARYYVPTLADAEEIVMDVLIALWKRRRTWRLRGALRAYLFGATRLECITWARRRRNQFAALDSAAREQTGGREADERIRADELRRALWRIVETMPERRRMVFLLSRQHELTYAEIAAVLDISVKTVEKHMTLALKTLRDRLAPLLGPMP